MRTAIRRQIALLEWALASLERNRGKTVALGLVLALVAFLLASFALLRASIRLEAAAVLAEAPDFVVQRLVAGRQELVPEAAVNAVRALPGVAYAQGRLWGYYYDPVAGANYTVTVPLLDPPAEGETAIGAAAARSRRLSRGDVLSLRSYGGEIVPFSMKAILPERADFIAGDVLLVSERDFRRLFALPADVVNDIVIFLAPSGDRSEVRKDILRIFPGGRVFTRDDLHATAAAFLDGRGGLAAAGLLAMGLALVLVALDKPFALGADEQQEMGILRALGWGRAEVLTAKAMESLAVSVTALLVGILAAYTHIYLFGASLFTPVLRGWAVVEPSLFPVPAFDVSFLSGVAAAVILLPLFGSLLAAHRYASGDPDSLIRQ